MVDLSTNSLQPTTLVVGSLASQGDYTDLLEQLKSVPNTLVRSEIIDRILDRAALIEDGSVKKVYITLSPDEFDRSLGQLVSALMASLSPNATVNIINPVDIQSTISTLLLAGLVNPIVNGPHVTAQKPLESLKRPNGVVSLKLARNKADKKASLWALTRSTAPSIDESTLLTDEDLSKAKKIRREDCDVKKTRRACKNCSCGLRELILQEDDDFGKGGNATKTLAEGVQSVSTGAATSSCGNCSLGDAFRCASCPYLGLPAFEVGQRVEIANLLSDDI